MRSLFMEAMILLFCKTAATINEVNKEGCTSPQFLELGKMGTINCFFENDFFGIIWYNSTDIVQQPILVMKNSIKSGIGFSSGEFDIHKNGSLRIRHVSLEHECTFTVLQFESNVADPDVHFVRVQTIQRPAYPYPLVSQCSNDIDLCFLHTSLGSEVKCSVSDSRPIVNLTWVARTAFSDRNVQSERKVYSQGIVYSSWASTRNAFHHTQNLAFLVCKAIGPKEVITQERKVLLVNIGNNFSSVIPKLVHFERNAQMKLDCGENIHEYPFIVWMRFVDGAFQHLTYNVNIAENFKSFSLDGYMQDNGSLFVSQATVQHEGFYYCIFGNGFDDGVTISGVSITVNPVPPYPVVDGCNGIHHCVMKKKSFGNITCSVYGIRPEVTLEWKTEDEKQSLISFSKDKVTVRESDGTFDVILTSKYDVLSVSDVRITVVCKISGPNAIFFDDLSNTFDLFLKGHHTKPSEAVLTTIITMTTFLSLCGVICGVVGIRAYLRNKLLSKRIRTYATEEAVPMTQNGDNSVQDTVHIRKDESDDEVTVDQIAQWEEKYTLQQNRSICQSSCKHDLNIVIVGKTGVGKSATANSILGEEVFFEDFSTVPTTLGATCATRKVNGRNISVIDTPGLHDQNQSPGNIFKELARIIVIFSNGVHAFLYILNARVPRFNEKELKAVKMFEHVFGNNIRNYRLLVYSNADAMDTETNLDKYWNQQKRGTGNVSEFLETFGQNVMAVNNKSDNEDERRRNQAAIIALIDSWADRECQTDFKNSLFLNAATEKERLILKAKLQNWNLGILDSIQEVFMAHSDLDTVSTEFKEKVLLHFEMQKSKTQPTHTVCLEDRVTSNTSSLEKESIPNKVINDVTEMCKEYDKVVRTVQNCLEFSFKDEKWV